MKRLSATSVRTENRIGRHSDGDGLFLAVGSNGSRSWVCRVQKDGRRRDFGLGSAAKVSLARARELSRQVRAWVEAGLDPVHERRKVEGIPTFREATATVFASHSKGWRNAKHNWQWLRSLEMFVFPKLGDKKVSEITGPQIHEVLSEIWLVKPETARRVRQRIGVVLDWAFSKGYRETEISMTSVTRGLPRQPKTTQHYAAMPYTDVAGFLIRLREKETMGRLALEFAIATAARSGEVRGAIWSEIDLAERLWTIPAERMKAAREHVVPLSDHACRIIARCESLRIVGGDIVFPGMKPRETMSDMTIVKVLRDMDEPYTPHGFRSAFRDWASETTDFPDRVVEAALAHAVKDKTEAAYRRGSLLEKRRDLMAEWCRFRTNNSPT
ncbi:tyrosine-type recombinase/integrase [Sphingopyxis flava]|uniref:tyrosine-type recombinase/integrase n=1 Tax=Sphingopyxis flava TaxID=1507287 RepID=UPI0009A6E673|nr:site-specific integrase [Sphingopyxis flava]